MYVVKNVLLLWHGCSFAAMDGLMAKSFSLSQTWRLVRIDTVSLDTWRCL